MYRKFGKRFFDIVVSSCALIALAPVMLIVAVLVRIKLGSPVIFSQERPGQHGKIFRLYKFRSMNDARDENGNLLPDIERVTRLGRILRTSSIDELPELWNVLKGDMSIVGPRPLLLKYCPYYTEEENRRHNVRPGLTGLAQVNGRNLLAWDERLSKDVYYVDNLSFLLDFKIILLTIIRVLKREGITIGGETSMQDFDVERQAHENCSTD